MHSFRSFERIDNRPPQVVEVAAVEAVGDRLGAPLPVVLLDPHEARFDVLVAGFEGGEGVALGLQQVFHVQHFGGFGGAPSRFVIDD